MSQLAPSTFSSMDENDIELPGGRYRGMSLRSALPVVAHHRRRGALGGLLARRGQQLGDQLVHGFHPGLGADHADLR